MTCGMSTVAGSIMVIYATVLSPVVDGALGHVLIASVINVIGAVVIARIMVPEDTAGAAGDLADDALSYGSTMDAVSRGTLDGLRLVANVGATVIVLVSLVALVNYALGAFAMGDAPLTLQRIVGWLFAPIAWLMGVPWAGSDHCGRVPWHQGRAQRIDRLPAVRRNGGQLVVLDPHHPHLRTLRDSPTSAAWAS